MAGLFGLFPRSAAGDPGEPADVTRVLTRAPVRQDTLGVSPGELAVCLGRPFVFASTLSVSESGRRWRAGLEYLLDADAGCLTLLTPDTLGAGRTLIVSYRALPVELAGVVQLQEDPHRRQAGRSAPVEEPDQAPVPFTSGEVTEGLEFSGSKTFGIEVGNRRDMKLSQSLDLRLTGNVTPEVTLLAILSDQDVPFQPEGNTAELAELDRVLVEIRSPTAAASLGDVGLAVTDMTFLQVDRQLEGFTGEAMWGSVRGKAAVASAKGEYATVSLFGVDGKQGPYVLTTRSDIQDIAIVAGSERVWLGGLELRRGEEEDYIINYSRGEVTFTSRRVITANSEITIDYQYVTGRYRRQVTFAGAQAMRMGSFGTLQAGYFVEGDDPDNAVGGELTPEEQLQLAALGDSATVDGGTRYVGDGQRDYELVVDPATGQEIFVWVEGTGDYEVAFVDVGEGKGDYDPDDEFGSARVVYRFVGDGEGTYTPSRDLPAPERRQITDLRWEMKGERGTAFVEGAASNNDGNVLSDIHDEDNQGQALMGQASLTGIAVAPGITVSPEVRVRRVTPDFMSPTRFRSSFYGRDWNLTGTETIGDENLLEGALDTRWGDRLTWRAEVGRLALADTFQAVRQIQSVHYTDAWVASAVGWITTSDDVSGRSGSLDRKRGDLTLRRWSVQPRVNGLHEERRRAAGDGERHREWNTGLLFPLASGSIEAEIGGGRRLDDSLSMGADPDWVQVRDAWTLFGTVEGRGRHLSGLFRYEARRVDEGAGPQRRDSGRLDLRHNAGRGAWSALVTADLGTVGLRRRTKSIVPVEDGTGYFDQFGNYVGPGGGYDVVYGPPSDETLTGSARLSTRLRWSPPGPEVGVPGILRVFSWEGYFNLTEASLLPLVTPRVFLDPDSYLNPETTVDGRINQRQILELFPRARKLGLRLRQERIESLVQNPQQSEEERLVEERSESIYAATLRSNPAPGWDAELEGTLTFRAEGVGVTGGAVFLQETERRAATGRGGRALTALGGRGRASAELTYSREFGEDREAVGWTFRPRLHWSLAGKGRVDLRYGLTRLTSLTGFTGTRGPGAPSLVPGQRLDFVGELRLHQSIVLTGVVAVNEPEGLDRVFESRIEVRGSF